MFSRAESPPEFSAVAQGMYDPTSRRTSEIEKYVDRFPDPRVGLCALYASMSKEQLTLEEFYADNPLATYLVVQGACTRDVYRLRKDDASPEHVEAHIRAVKFLLRGWEHPLLLGDVDAVLLRTLRQLVEFKALCSRPMDEM